MIAIIGAHPDDAELSAGGLLALKQKDAIMLSVTHGAYSSFTGSGHRTPQEAITEMKASAESLRCEWEIWGYELDLKLNMDLVYDLDCFLEKHDIDTVITHYVYDTHHVHRIIAEATIAAARRIPNLLMMEPPPHRMYEPFKPQLYVNITEVYETKHAAILQYKTQKEKYLHEWVETMNAREIIHGNEVGVERAEAFQIIRLLGGLL